MYDKLGALDRAVEDFTRAIESEPTNAVYSHNRGYCYRNMGDYDRYAGEIVAMFIATRGMIVVGGTKKITINEIPPLWYNQMFGSYSYDCSSRMIHDNKYGCVCMCSNQAQEI